MKKYRNIYMKMLLIVFALILSNIGMIQAANPPTTINYQGYLTDTSGEVTSAGLGVLVKIYTASTGGSPVYTEIHSSVSVSSGQFTVLIGSENQSGAGTTWSDVDFSLALWLGITIDPNNNTTVAADAAVGGTTGDDENFTTRIPLEPAPYARMALGVSGGSVDGATVGATSPNTGAFTSLEASLTTTLNAGLAVKNGATSAGSIEIYEDTDDGSNKVSIQAQTLGADYTLTLPVDDGNNGEFLQTNGSGSLSWASTAGSGDVTDVGDSSGPTAFTGANDGNSLIFEGATNNANDTTLTAADPGSNITITLPATTGTVVTTGDTATVTGTMIAGDTIAAGDIATNAVTTTEILDGTIVAADIASNGVTTDEILNGTITASDIANDAVTLSLMASGTDGNLISYDASGNPAAVATGSSGDVLTSNGAGAAPTFQASGGSGDVTDVGDSSGPTAFTGNNDGNSLTFEGATPDANETVLTAADPGGDFTITLPATTGTLVTTGDTATVSSTMIAVDTIVAGDIATGGVTTDEILDNTVAAADLSATLTLSDGDLLDLGSIDSSGTGEGLILPQAADVSGATAEGQISWDSDDDTLYVGNGGGVTAISGGGGGDDLGNHTATQSLKLYDATADSIACNAGNLGYIVVGIADTDWKLPCVCLYSGSNASSSYKWATFEGTYDCSMPN